MIEFSIIMPVFNSQATLSKAIDSVLKQKVTDWELIIIDDGSTDNSRAIIDKYCECNKNIKYYFQKNSGPGAARNHGIDLSSGRYIAFLDSDDYWSDDFLLLIKEKINDNQPDIVFYDIVREDQNGKTIGFSKPSRFKKQTKHDLIVLQGSGTLEWGMTKVIRSSIIKGHHILFSSLSVGEEAIFSLQILLFCDSVSFIDKPLYHYVDSNTSQHNRGNIDPWKGVVELFVKFFEEHNNLTDYKEAILNHLALKSLAININRICLSLKYKLAKATIKKSVKSYSQKFNIFDCKKQYLEKKVYYVLCLLKIRFYFTLFVLARMRG